jgi:hypothetical protein
MISAAVSARIFEKSIGFCGRFAYKVTATRVPSKTSTSLLAVGVGRGCRLLVVHP